MVENAMQAAFSRAYGDKKVLPGGLQVDIKKVNRERRTKVMRDLRRILGDFHYELHRGRFEKMKLDYLFELRTLGHKSPGELRDSLMCVLYDETREEVIKLVDRAVKSGKVPLSERQSMIRRVLDNSMETFKEEAKKIADLKAKERAALSQAKREASRGKRRKKLPRKRG